ncbi:DUF4279 domain-containing protein [Fimbriiglobus ruber]|uniref:DUF4279 domain-containing protein n=1 Tax=Fimbriiglobus ruber TaxID=1908690 RepID=UPI000B4B47F0|nr:DUF4279 domain-containing protein [Fimbriiglobus ruber]
MADMREAHCCSVTLIVVGDDLEPEDVTSALGWNPDHSWRRGEHKRFKRPDGTERVFDSIHDRGGWKLFTADDERERSLQYQVTAWLGRLHVKGPALLGLRGRGWDIGLNCFAATSECLDLPVTALGELVSMGVGLSLTFSADTDEIVTEPVAAPEPAK